MASLIDLNSLKTFFNILDSKWWADKLAKYVGRSDATGGPESPIILNDENKLVVRLENSAHEHTAGRGLVLKGSNTGGVKGTVTYQAQLKDNNYPPDASGRPDATSIPEELEKGDTFYPVTTDANGNLAVFVPWQNSLKIIKAEADTTSSNGPVYNSTLKPNLMYIFDSDSYDGVGSINIDLDDSTSSALMLHQLQYTNEFAFQFESGETPTTFMVPENIKWVNGVNPTIKSNKIYQVSIINNLGCVLEFNK